MKTRYFSIFLAFALLVVNCQISIAQKQLYVLHSSDTHSRIDPIDAKQSTRNANMGGVARRAGFVSTPICCCSIVATSRKAHRITISIKVRWRSSQ